MKKRNPERRRHARAAANLLIQYRFDTFEAFVTEYIEEISEGGLSVRNPELIRPVGTTVHLQFVLRDGTWLIEGLARVARIEETPERRMALEFVDIDEASVTLIRRMVQEGADEEVPTEDLLFGL